MWDVTSIAPLRPRHQMNRAREAGGEHVVRIQLEMGDPSQIPPFSNSLPEPTNNAPDYGISIPPNRCWRNLEVWQLHPSLAGLRFWCITIQIQLHGFLSPNNCSTDSQLDILGETAIVRSELNCFVMPRSQLPKCGIPRKNLPEPPCDQPEHYAKNTIPAKKNQLYLGGGVHTRG